MSEKTKACNLTEDEMWAVQQYHARQIINFCGPNYDAIDRINYLNKRLKTFNEVDKGTEVLTVTEQSEAAANTGAWPNG